MFLTFALRRLRQDDRGAALAAVIGLMATGLILTAVIGGTVVSAMGFTTSTRAGVQSQAAAEAGIAAARAGLVDGTCGAQPISADAAPAYRNPTGTDPVYEATIWRSAGGGAWTPGCPLSLTTQVRILSTGYASANGVVGDAGDVTTLEALLSAPTTPTTIIANGPAVYAYNAGSFGNGGTLVSLDGSTPDVIVANGNLTCNNNFSATANLVVNSGTLTVDNGCDISGNTWAAGRVNMINNSEIGGGVIAFAGISMFNSSKAGRIWSYLDLTTDGNPTVYGQAKAMSMNFGGGSIEGAGYVYGGFKMTKNTGGNPFNVGVVAHTISGDPPKQWNVKVKNPISPTFGSDVPAKPTVPSWIDFGSKPEHYTTQTWSGFTIVTMGTDCSAPQVIAKIATLGGAPGVLDGRACVGDLRMDNNYEAKVYNDLAIIAPRILFDNQGTLDGENGEHDLWLINPDGTAKPGEPDTALCSSSYIKVQNNAKFKDLRALFYSPCTVTTVAGTTIKGQIFAGSTSMTNNSTLQYTAVGLPGYDLKTGAATSVTSVTEADRELLYVRNIAEVN